MAAPLGHRSLCLAALVRSTVWPFVSRLPILPWHTSGERKDRARFFGGVQAGHGRPRHRCQEGSALVNLGMTGMLRLLRIGITRCISEPLRRTVAIFRVRL